MKKNLFFAALVSVFVLSACGKAAEDREAMHKRAKEFQDSIANVIRMSMKEAEMPTQPMPAPAPAPTGTPAPAQH